MKICCAVIVAAIALVAGPNVSAQQSAKTISADLAAIMVQEAVLKCRADGVRITAKVVDASNLEKALLSDDGAAALTVEFAQAKINTVILTGRPSGAGPGGAPEVIEGASPGMSVFGGMIGIDAATGALIAGVDAGGAVPIKIGNEMVGVIAVSGASSPAKDIECANAALAKVADELK